jgi:NAD(P)-dependent dehydrogenase (short-subunit alcohol dehydrogenase family)
LLRDLAGSVVVITGASSGIGRAAALRFARDCVRLALAARGETPCRARSSAP